MQYFAFIIWHDCFFVVMKLLINFQTSSRIIIKCYEQKTRYPSGYTSKPNISEATIGSSS